MKFLISNLSKCKCSILEIKKLITNLKKNFDLIKSMLLSCSSNQKLKLYHQLRIHAKSNRDKILRIFTHKGNIIHVDAVDNEIKVVNSENDIKNI